MGFKRVCDSSYPYTWDSWETDGVSWSVRDLPPEDYEDAIKIMEENFCGDEALCSASGLINEPASVRGITDFWRVCLTERMSLGCYVEKDGKRKLVALNVCVVCCRGDKEPDYVIEGKAWKNVYMALKECDKLDAFQLLDADKLLYGYGLVVSKEYRGAYLGSRILNAREPLSLHHCITATSTVFTGPASQKNAQNAGFTTALTVTFKELAEAGLDYPADENRCIKLMVKKYKHDIKKC